MVDVIAVVEGQSEREFAHHVLAAHLGSLGVRLHPAVVGKPGHKGGTARGWESVRDDICDHLRSGAGRRRVFVTTMVDYYGMPTSWPGRAAASAKPLAQRATAVESAMHTNVKATLGANFDPALFLPYVQMHELEALMFVDPLQLKYQFVERSSEVEALAESVRGMKPEEINDSMESAPSKRIIHHLPEYEGNKPLACSEVLRLIGLPALRAGCPHFAEWLARLESLAPSTAAQN